MVTNNVTTLRWFTSASNNLGVYVIKRRWCTCEQLVQTKTNRNRTSTHTHTYTHKQIHIHNVKRRVNIENITKQIAEILQLLIRKFCNFSSCWDFLKSKSRESKGKRGYRYGQTWIMDSGWLLWILALVLLDSRQNATKNGKETNKRHQTIRWLKEQNIRAQIGWECSYEYRKYFSNRFFVLLVVVVVLVLEYSRINCQKELSLVGSYTAGINPFYQSCMFVNEPSFTKNIRRSIFQLEFCTICTNGKKKKRKWYVMLANTCERLGKGERIQRKVTQTE